MARARHVMMLASAVTAKLALDGVDGGEEPAQGKMFTSHDESALFKP